MLSKLDRLVGRAEMTVAGSIVAVICLVVFLQVLCRYVLHSPLAWTEELARYLQVWLTAIGAAIGMRLGTHFHLDIIHLAIPKGLLRYYKVLVLLTTLLFIVMLAYYGEAMLSVVQRQQSPAMNVSMFYPYLAIPVGACLMGFHVIVRICELLSGADGAAEEENH